MVDFKEIAKKWQNKWEETKIFEAAPYDNKQKFFMTIPDPYISGSIQKKCGIF